MAQLISLIHFCRGASLAHAEAFVAYFAIIKDHSVQTIMQKVLAIRMISLWRATASLGMLRQVTVATPLVMTQY